MTSEPIDPITQKRERIRGQAQKAQRVGYVLYGVATILFFVGITTTLSNAIVWSIVTLLIVGSIVLAVAIQVGYAIRGAERHEEDSRAMRRRR